MATVEILAAAVLAALTARAPVDRPWVLAAWLWLALLGIALAVIDATVHRLPDPLTTTATGGVLLLLAADAVTSGDITGLVRALACSAGLGAVYLIAVLTPAGMGRGDAHLALSLGLVCGRPDPRATRLGRHPGHHRTRRGVRRTRTPHQNTPAT
jgi:leader peptidase (prepilin peptidase)/N-methyltransferase